MSVVTHWHHHYTNGSDQNAIYDQTAHNGFSSTLENVEVEATEFDDAYIVVPTRTGLYGLAPTRAHQLFPPQDLIDILYNVESFSYNVNFGRISESDSFKWLRRDIPEEEAESEYMSDSQKVFGFERGGIPYYGELSTGVYLIEEDDNYGEPNTGRDIASFGINRSIEYVVFDHTGPAWEVSAAAIFTREEVDDEGQFERTIYRTQTHSSKTVKICGYDVPIDEEFDGSITVSVNGLF